METPPLDPSLPGVRQLQSWIRERVTLSIQLENGHQLEGVLEWQDPEFLALRQSQHGAMVLVSRASLALLRPLA